MQRWISGDQGTFRPCHLLASAHPKTHQTQRLGQVLASRLIAAPTDAWFLGSSVFELGLIELSWVLTVLIHHIQRNSGRFSGMLWHFHDPNLTSQNFTAWRAASKALRCRGSPRGAAPRSCCSARRKGRSFDLRFRRDADVSRLLAANYTNTFNHLYIYKYIYILIYLYSALLPARRFIVVAHLSPDVPEPWSTKPTHQWLVPVPSAHCEGHRAITLRIPRPNQGHPEEMVCWGWVLKQSQTQYCNLDIDH